MKDGEEKPKRKKDRRRFDAESHYKEFVRTGDGFKYYFQLLKYRRKYRVDIRLKAFNEKKEEWLWSKNRAVVIHLEMAKKLPTILRELADVVEEYYKEFIQEDQEKGFKFY